MSVYSGYATRQLENQYNKLLVSLIKILQRRIVKFYKNEKTDEEAFKSVMHQTVSKMSVMEQSKFCEPYMSTFLIELQTLLKFNQLPCNCNCHEELQKKTFVTHSEVQPSYASTSRKQTVPSSRKSSLPSHKTAPKPTEIVIPNVVFQHSPYFARRTTERTQSGKDDRRTIGQFYKFNKAPAIRRNNKSANKSAQANPNESLEERCNKSHFQ